MGLAQVEQRIGLAGRNAKLAVNGKGTRRGLGGAAIILELHAGGAEHRGHCDLLLMQLDRTGEVTRFQVR